MFSTAKTFQDHRPPRGRIALPQTVVRLAGAASLAPGAFLKFYALSAGEQEQTAAAGTTMECNGVHR